MWINIRLNRIELTTPERLVLEKADNLLALIAKYCDGAVKEEASKTGFHIERLRKLLSSEKLNEEPVQ